MFVPVTGERKALSGSTMLAARKRIAKDKGADPDAFEESVAQVCRNVMSMQHAVGLVWSPHL